MTEPTDIEADAPPPTLEDILAHIKWDLSDESREIVRHVLETNEPPAAVARTVAMRLAGLEFERWGALDAKKRITDLYAAREEPTREMVKRLWTLYDRKRKTLSMQALHDALGGRDT